MHIVLIVIYCLMAALILFGLTFHDKMVSAQRRPETARPLIVIEGGKSKLRRRSLTGT